MSNPGSVQQTQEYRDAFRHVERLRALLSVGRPTVGWSRDLSSTLVDVENATYRLAHVDGDQRLYDVVTRVRAGRDGLTAYGRRAGDAVAQAATLAATVEDALRSLSPVSAAA
jgi:hypothetical protein